VSESRATGRMKRRRRTALIAVGAALLLYLFLGGSDGFYAQYRMSREVRSLRNENMRLRMQNERMRAHIVRLQRDMDYIERVARERYGMARPSERVYRVLPATDEMEQGKSDD